MTKIFISAGDTSGELHAANLIRSIKQLDPKAYVTALGGSNLSAVSDLFLYNLIDLSAFGFLAPFKQVFKLRRILKNIKKYWKNNKPDKVILVDYYGFNIHIAKEAFSRGIPVYYYISPQVWASRPGRINKIKKYVKKMLVILPFEEKLYQNCGVDAVFVGHPLIDIVPEPEKNSEHKIQIGLFPGSRENIVLKHLEILQKAADLIKEQLPCEFVIFGTNNLKKFYNDVRYPVVFDTGFAKRKNLSFAISVSGTVSLENTLLGIPMIIMYKLSWLNYFAAKLLVNVKYITMANILLDKMAVPEFIQADAEPEKIANKAVAMLNDKVSLADIGKQLRDIRKLLGTNGVTVRAAKIILGD